MSNFKTHIVGGATTGMILSVSFLLLFPDKLDFIQILNIFILTSIGGILPDIDSNTGKTIDVLSDFVYIICILTGLSLIKTYYKFTIEFLLCYFVVVYILVKYGLYNVIKATTKHRGILHSIPFLVLVSEIIFLVFRESSQFMGIVAAISIFVGGFIHLIQDELNSISWKSNRKKKLIFKRSFGSTLKFRAKSSTSTVIMYISILMLMIYITKRGLI